MKNIKVVLKILILFAAIAIPLHSTIMVRADSGWDSDYGGSSFGGSSFGGSSWSSSSSSWSSGGSSSRSSSTWSSGGSSGGYSGSNKLSTMIGDFFVIVFIFIIYFCFCLFIDFIVGLFSHNHKYKNRQLKYQEYGKEFERYNQLMQNDISEEEVQKYLPGESLESLKNKLFGIYKDVQIAWMNFDYDKLKELCSNDLATTYIGQLEMLKVKKGQNIMSDWSLENAKITKIVETSDFVYITGIFDTRFYDYVINTESGLVTRGYKQIKVHNIYEMLFVVNKKLASGLYKCPKCGATIKPNKEGRCHYCHTAVSFTNSKIVLSRKSRIN